MAHFRSLNRFQFIGRVGNIDEVRTVKAPTRNKFLNISLATTEVSHGGKKHTWWHRVTVWGKTTEFVEKFVHVGDMLITEGKISYSYWEDDDGNKRRNVYFNAREVQLIYQSYKNQQEHSYEKEDGEQEEEEDNDDPPF